MTDQTNAQDLDEEAAAHQLHVLEQTAVEGGDVTPAELAEARERVTLAKLFARGRAARAEAQREQDAAAGRVSAKQQAALIAQNVGEDIDSTREALTSAVASFMAAIARQNEQVREITRIFDQAGIVRPNAWGATDPFDFPGIDRENYAWVEQGEEVRRVQVGGRTLNILNRKQLLVRALNSAVAANGLGRAVTIEN